MAVLRMDHVGVVVDDLDAAIAFFVELGLELHSQTQVEGDLVDRVVGLDGVRSEIAMVRSPDGHNTLELVKFHSPTGGDHDDAGAPSDARGIRHLTFAVDDLDDVLARLEPHGAELVGEVVDYGNVYRLCYIRGPEGIIIELAERIG